MTCPWDPLEYLRWRRTGQWIRLRQDCFARDHWMCVVCGARQPAAVTDTPLQAHHKIYRARPEMTLLEDLETRCEKHHQAFHENQRAKKRQVVRRERRFERRRENRRGRR